MARTKKGPKKNGVAKPPLRLDLGCGPNKKDGFLGVDIRQFDGKVDVVFNLAKGRWPWNDSSVDEVHCSHMVEHLTWPERVHFFNELYRVLKLDAKALIITPHWASSRFYGDPTHKEPFSEWAWFYMNQEWRKNNAPHTDYICNFDHTYSYGLHPALQGRNPENINYAITFYKEACTDMIATLTKKPLAK